MVLGIDCLNKKIAYRKQNHVIFHIRFMKQIILLLILMNFVFCKQKASSNNDIRLWYQQPAAEWTEALPIGNGRLGAMVFGTVVCEHIQFNEETLWTGEPNDYAHKGAYKYLDEIRGLLFEGKQKEAEELAMKEFMSIPLRQKAYQPFGDLYIEFPGHNEFSDYKRELNIGNAICKTTYMVKGVAYEREVLASFPHQVIAVNLSCDKDKALNFSFRLNAEHVQKSIFTKDGQQTLSIAVTDGVLHGLARIKIDTDGKVISGGDKIEVKEATKATLYLSASTNFVNYNDVSKDPETELSDIFSAISALSYSEIKTEHITDFQNLFNRFEISFGSNEQGNLSTDKRLFKFQDSPNDPSLIALYIQYGRYLLISSSRSGTQPANLQGIWNKDIKPAWESKYTTNINAEMNYWPAELTNLTECHEPFFDLIKDCSKTGSVVAREHYNCDGWILHHNTDIWRGTAPINNSNHGIWPGGGAWVTIHLWEHYLFTHDVDFLRECAYSIMKESALFYSQFLIPDPKTGWLISTPSNSPENGGLVAGPTMDHQLIRSLFKACVEASQILNIDTEFAKQLESIIPKIAPNQIGQHGQLQEWLEDIDDPNNKHRHVSHLWGMHPGADITWEKSPDLMEAVKQSLYFRGDDGTGWSLAWKINFWARLLDGNHAYELIKLLFRPVSSQNTAYQGGGGSYLNLFDAHPPFQIDGNFGAAAGVVELLIQSHQGYVELLPALPDALSNGKISGVCARGGFELAFGWKDGVLQQVDVLSKAGKKCKLKYGDNSIEFDTKKNKTYHLTNSLKFQKD
jgi:alpha-L-fucosidase 2